MKTHRRVAVFILPLVLLVLSLNSTTAPAQEGRMKIILDTDIGDDIDDAWALAFVIRRRSFETLGVTIAHGPTALRSRIACKMLHLAGRGEIPVAVGRETNDPRWHYQFSWAEDFEKKKPIQKPAADFIVEQVRKHPGQVTIVAVGPLENLADALRREPNLPKLVKRVVLMSGCVYGSEWSPDKPMAEYNVAAAAADAQLVYGAGLPLTIVPLDATTKVQLKDEEREEVRKHDSPLTRSVECLYRLWIANRTQRMTLHDQLAIAETADPGSFFGKLETLPLVVDEKGFTRIDREKGRPVTVCLEPKRDEFMRYYIAQLTGKPVSLRLPDRRESSGAARASLSKTDFEVIEGRFHDGLGTYAEIMLANELLALTKLDQSPFDPQRSRTRMQEAIASLPASHPSRAIFQQEIANIEKAVRQGAGELLARAGSGALTRVRHTPREFADARAGDLILEFADHQAMPVSVKTDKSGRVAVAEGQTPDIGPKWAERYFKVSDSELNAMITELGFASPAELKGHYLNVSRLVAQVIIRKLELTDCQPGDFSQAQVGNLEAAKYLFLRLLHYKHGNDDSRVIIFDRRTGRVRWESLLEDVNIESLTRERISFTPAHPKGGEPVGTTFGIRIDGRTVVTFQVKHKRGRARGTASQYEFGDITTRLEVARL
ncbi:MAG TPA: nucleoside hydrolase [Blastocatellia bacterium]|nr:nucleoside hydrolase [Blastocatellia bacterium]